MTHPGIGAMAIHKQLALRKARASSARWTSVRGVAVDGADKVAPSLIDGRIVSGWCPNLQA
jgi:hypothetical protein